MKKKILFSIDSLKCAGAEKSLVTLLGLLDYTKYDVDLMLFARNGELENLVPKEVNILHPLKYMDFAKMSIIKSILYSIKTLNFKMLSSRVRYSSKIRRKKYNNHQKARLFWHYVSDVIEMNPISYDIAIAYAQGVPTFYVVEKIKANKKFAWVNVSYRLFGKDKEFQRRFYNQMDQIVAVSDSTRKILLETFPEYTKKVEVIYDINDPHFISSMAEVGNGYEDSFNGIRILTIGRLAKQKGYDIALEACKKLMNQGIKFRWYILGKGPLENEIKTYIEEHGLSDHFKLLGVKSNPYPFIKNADIYVQTSKFEGFGLAIAEARMLNIPVVTTRFDAVYNQMVDGFNGLVVDMNSDAVCEAILKIIKEDAIREHIISYLQKEKKGNLEEVEKFYDLIG